MLLTKSALQIKREELTRLKDALQKIRNEKRLSISQADGDGWHDNFGFEQAISEEKMVIDRIYALDNEITSATIIDENSDNKTFVGVGSSVNLKLDYGDDDIEYFVGKLVAFPGESSQANEITVNSSIGRSILQKKVGDTVQAIIPSGEKVNIEILDVY